MNHQQTSQQLLPYPRNPEFPKALKACREMRGMSRAELAEAAGIHKVMIRRYEEPDCAEFTRPRPESTWLALNRALGFEIPDDVHDFIAQIEDVYEKGLLGSGPLDPHEGLGWDDGADISSDESLEQDRAEGLLLRDASLEDIVEWLHRRNIEPTFRYVLKP